LTEDSTDKSTDDDTTEPIRVSFSIPQITGGALASATAAVIGSQLGVAGTIAGAAVASVIGGVAGTLYSAGIDRTHRKVTRAIKRTYDRAQLVEDSDQESLATSEGMPEGRDEAALTDTDRDLEPVATSADPPPSRSNRRRILERMALTVAAMFVVALVVITAVELGIGRSLDGSAGTSLGQVTRPHSSVSVTPTVAATPSRSATSMGPNPSPSPTFSIGPTSSAYPSASQIVVPMPSATLS
jgi:hypothetical protein